MLTATALAAAATGLLFGLSLIVAIGPQNSYVIRQGLRREHVLLVVAVCAASDVLLIAGGVGGAGAVLAGRDWLVRLVTVAGVAFLVGYGILAARRALRPPESPDGAVASRPGRSRTAALAACLAFTFLNPGVYVDTVFLVGPVSQSHGDARWWFALGAMVASAAWFVALGFGAAAASGLFDRPKVWRVLDASVAVIMFLTAVRLALEV